MTSASLPGDESAVEPDPPPQVPEAEPAAASRDDEPITVMVGAKHDEAADAAAGPVPRTETAATPDPAAMERRSFLMSALQSLAYD